MTTPFQTFLAGLLMAAAPVSLHAASTLRFALSVVSVAENAGNAEVTVLRANDLDTAVTVNYATTGLGATAGADYTETSGRLAFSPGESVKVIAISILNDELRESTEALRLTLSDPEPGAVLGSPNATTILIFDNDFGVSFAQPVYFITEQAGEIQTIVVRGNDVDLREFTVDYVTVAGGATAGTDFVAASGTLSFAAGQLSRELPITIVNDELPEANETFSVTLSNATGGSGLGSLSSTQVTIRDKDGGVRFVSGAMTVSEDAGELVLGVVRRDDGNLQAFTVEYATTDISATAGVDYVARSGTLSFAVGQPSQELRIPILNDGLNESNKTFRVTLSNATGGLSLGTPKDSNITIADNDGGVRFSLATYTVPEDGGRVHLSVLRGNDVEVGPFTVDYTTADVTATAGTDYIARSGTLSFAAGQQSQDLPIEILNDGIREVTQSLHVTLSQVVGAAAAGTPLTATVTIEDNDPGLGFEFASYSVWENSGRVAVNVVRGNDGDLGPFTVEVNSADLTAQAGSDFQAVSSVLDFKADQTVMQVVVPLVSDSVAEGIQPFRLTLTNATGGFVLGTTSTTVSINDTAAPGAFYAFTPSEASSLSIERDGDINVISWVGTGQLQRADQLPGPWANLSSARSPFRSASLLPESFYRVRANASRLATNVYVPAGYDPATPIPLVILLHGYTRTGAVIDADWGLRPFADSRRFLYCFPDATVNQGGSRFWNATDACCDFDRKGVDDALYLRQLIEEIGQAFSLDRKRVYLAGWSNGGFMSYRMACEHSDIIAGIASLAGMMFVDSTRCQPSEPVNILQIHGTADNIVPYGGGRLGAGLPQTGEFPSALECVEMWAAYNQCAGPVTGQGVSMDLDLGVPGLDTVVMRYTDCPPGGAVELWTINGGSHGPTFHTASTESEFATRAIDWLLAHPKP